MCLKIHSPNPRTNFFYIRVLQQLVESADQQGFMKLQFLFYDRIGHS